MKYTFTNILGTFDTDLIKLEKSRKKLPAVPQDNLPKVLALFKDKRYFDDFYKNNLELTKNAVKESVSEDLLIIQTISNVNELDKIINILTKRLREWYALYFPEFEHKFTNNEKFAELILTKSKKELIKEFNLKDTMGADLDRLHLGEMQLLAKQISNLNLLRQEHENYLEKVMKKYCPNILELAGTTIGAKLVELGKGLKHLALLPSSTIQLLGAEKALFRHIKTGSRSPKYGIIINHPIIQKAKKSDKGKAARSLADKLSLCARLDFFKGEFKAKEYRKELEGKFKD